jgi:hypothetical protein
MKLYHVRFLLSSNGTFDSERHGTVILYITILSNEFFKEIP